MILDAEASAGGGKSALGASGDDVANAGEPNVKN